MMIQEVLLLLAGIIGLIFALRTANRVVQIITAALLVGLVCVINPFSLIWLKTLGFAIYGLSTLGVIIYAFFQKRITTSARLIIALVSIPVFLYWFFALMHYPGAAIIKYATIIPVVAFLVGVFKGKTIREELGFLIILTVDAFIVFAGIWVDGF